MDSWFYALPCRYLCKELAGLVFGGGNRVPLIRIDEETCKKIITQIMFMHQSTSNA
jgi:hypothetical protein